MCGLCHNAQLWKTYQAHAPMWLPDDLFSCSDEVCFFLLPTDPASFFVDNLCLVPFCVIHSKCEMCSSILDFDVSPVFMLQLCVMVNMQFLDSCISFLDLVLVTMLHVCDLNAVHITPLLQIL